MSTINRKSFALANSFLWKFFLQQIASIPEGEDFTYITRWDVIHNVLLWLKKWWEVDRVDVIFEQKVFLESQHMSPDEQAECCVRMERQLFDAFLCKHHGEQPVSNAEHAELKCHLCKEKVSGCKCESIATRVWRESVKSLLCAFCDADPCECDPPRQRW
jgi:hypothetical protein